MKAPTRPTNEIARLEALRRYDLLDTLPERDLDDLASLASHICAAPISLVSLVDAERQWFKSALGVSIKETPRDISFCGHAILGRDLFIVPDALENEVFADNPLVIGEPHIRFYAGAPLTTPDGHVLGALCVMDHVPRQLDPSQAAALRALSRQVIAQLELRRQARDLADSEERLIRVFRSAPTALAIHRMPDRTFVDVNAAFTTLLGWTRDEVVGHTSQSLGLVGEEQSRAVRKRLEQDRTLRNEELSVLTKEGVMRHVLMSTELVELQRVPHALTTFVDVTPRKEREAALQRLAAIVESSDDAIIGKDLEGTITSWNGGAERIFGYTAQEMVGASIRILIPQDRQSEEDFILGRIARGEGVEHFETVRVAKHGHVVDVSVVASPIRDAEGYVVGVSKVARDIGARKKADAVLKERDEQLRLYAEHSPAAVAMFDRQMRYLVASRRWLEDYDLPEQPSGRSHYDVFPEISEEWRAVHQRCLAGAVEKSEEEPFVRADGRTIWIRWEVRPWHRSDGAVGGIIIFSEDVTQRRESTAALASAEQRMRFALESADVGIWDVDYASGVVRWSTILEAQYGLRPGSFNGTFQAFLQCVHPDDRQSVADIISKAAESGRDFSLQHRGVRPDGSVRWMNGAGRVQLGPDGTPVRGVGISLDVTERHILEAQYQQAQKMEAVGRLAGGVAHDFNNLLTAILGYCELILGDLKADDPLSKDVAEIHKAGSSAARLTKQLLAFSRKQIIEPRLLDLNVVVSDLRAMLGRVIGEDVTITVALQREPATVMIDRGQLEQVLMNLAVNARDAMPTGGNLTIETFDVELDANYAVRHFAVEPGSYVALIVTDTGMGMSDDVQAHLFEPFFTTKELGKGTGLGLATVHGIVARSGGSVTVYSEPGKGSSFKIYLPRISAAAAPLLEGRGHAPDIAGPSHTVLVVEDDADLRQLTRRLLGRLGYEALVAYGATDAFRLLDQHPAIDLVLTDVVMPGVSGPELAKRLQARRPDLQIVYMSGYTEEAIVRHGVLNQGIAFIHKPFTLDSLSRKLREIFHPQ